MATTSLSRFAALHRGPGPFLLPNCWDVASAVLLADAGFPAVGTTSLGITAAAGLLVLVHNIFGQADPASRSAIGMAMRGYRPVAELQFDGFTAPAFDQIVSQLARYRARVGGRWSLPVTIRVPYGGGVGSPEHHSE